ncbi:transposase, partial [Glaesserella parasuis]|uniref:transposase n=1 Tax=Glaesserella parasuis TaxID=738 RepID=UPI002A219A5C|nr:transposase [Glaesserella parasuis]
MNYEPKNVIFCHSSDIRKHGIRNNIQRYKCNACNKTFTLKKKLNPISIWNDYSIGKQTYKQLAEKYHCSIRTIQRYLEKAPKTVLNP